MIGIFDSGVGGLTVVKEIFKQLPDYQIVYFGDTARAPYGGKSAKTIVDYAIENTEFLIEQGAQIIVVACNTASALAIEELRKRFSVPIFEVISPAVEKALAVGRGKVGVIGTRGTINSKIYEKKILAKNKNWKVFSQACPLLVPLIEEGWLASRETKMILRKYLFPLKTKQIDSLILGCTHYPLLKDLIQIKIGRRVNLIDSGEEVVYDIKKYLAKNPKIKLAKNKKHQFFVSDITPHFQKIAEKFLAMPVKLTRR